MAHPCGDPNRATQCRAYRVAPNSRRIRDVVPKSRYTPPNQGVAPFSGPPRRRQGAKEGGGCPGGLVEGIAALLGSENGSRYRGVSQLQSHQSRYSVQLRPEINSPRDPSQQKLWHENLSNPCKITALKDDSKTISVM